MYVPVYLSSAIHSVTSSSSERATPNSQSYDQNGFSVCCNKEISQKIKRAVPEIQEEGDEIRFRSFHRKSYVCLTWIYRWNRWKRFLYLMRNLKHIGDLYERQTRQTYLHWKDYNQTTKTQRAVLGTHWAWNICIWWGISNILVTFMRDRQGRHTFTGRIIIKRQKHNELYSVHIEPGIFACDNVPSLDSRLDCSSEYD